MYRARQSVASAVRLRLIYQRPGRGQPVAIFQKDDEIDNVAALVTDAAVEDLLFDVDVDAEAIITFATDRAWPTTVNTATT